MCKLFCMWRFNLMKSLNSHDHYSYSGSLDSPNGCSCGGLFVSFDEAKQSIINWLKMISNDDPKSITITITDLGGLDHD